MGASSKRRSKKLVQRALLLIDGILIVGFITASFFLVRVLVNYARMRRDTNDLASAALQTALPPESTPLSPEPSGSGDVSGSTPDSASATRKTSDEVPITVDFDALSKVNPDIIAWIYSEGTEINYPIVQGDDNEYYLDKNYSRKQSDGGAIFMDCRNNRRLLDQNTIIYGHHMKDRTMFGSLANYYKQEYYQAHRVLYLLTPEQDYRLEVYSVRTTKPEAQFYYIWFDPESTIAYESYITKAIGQSVVVNETDMSKEYNTITLSTCSYYAGFEDAKFLVHCKLVPLGDG